jgi:hypothetical protein
MTTDQASTQQQNPIREQLATLIERWEEVADSYKPLEGSKHDDLEERYRNYRYIQRRAIRDLKHVLDSGTVPCELMTVEERRRGDCGQIHRDDSEEDSGTAPAFDPWGPQPDISANVPEPVRHILADRLAHMLLGPRNGALQVAARELTFALKAEGFNLSDAIRQNITDLTLGPDPVDVPF